MTESIHLPENERAMLRRNIGELTDRMIRALDRPEGAPPEQGQETASYADIRSCLSTVLDVYKTLHGLGDLDTGGEALNGYRGVMNGGDHKPSVRAGNRHRGRGASA